MTFADRVIAFNRKLSFTASLPPGISIMNPFQENPHALVASEAFYRTFYADNHPRHLILGINPGRHGAGVTGIPFTDTKRLENPCGLSFSGPSTHEPSAVFVYEVIAAFGGPAAFYRHFFINSVCPLGFTKINERGSEVNYNYYDSKALTKAALPFILQSIGQLIDLGVETQRAFCFGTGKNYAFLESLNAEHRFFGEIIPLEHPRYIMQYKSRFLPEYIDKYLAALGKSQGPEE